MMASSVFPSIMVGSFFFGCALSWPLSTLVGEAGEGDSTLERSSDFRSAVFGSLGVETGV